MLFLMHYVGNMINYSFLIEFVSNLVQNFLYSEFALMIGTSDKI